MIRFMPGVQVNYFHSRLLPPLEYACAWALLARVAVDINSIDDKTHGANSLHHFSLAIDLDTDGDRVEDLARLHGFLARYLPPEWDVVLEKDHVHVELDMRRKPVPIAPPRPPRPPGTPT